MKRVTSRRGPTLLQPLEEDEGGHLFVGGQWIRETIEPEEGPKGVDLRFELWIGEHDDSRCWFGPYVALQAARSGFAVYPVVFVGGYSWIPRSSTTMVTLR